MVFTKKFQKKRRVGRRRVGGLAKVKADIKALKRLTRPEWKVSENSLGGTVSDTGTLILMNGLVQGDDFTQRDGRVVNFKSVQMSMRFVQDTGATTNSTRINWALILDKAPFGGTPTIAAIYSNLEAGFRNLDNRKNFTILKRGTIVVDSDDATKVVNFYHKFGRSGIETVYDASNNGDITDIASNAIYLLMWGSQGTGDYPDRAVNFRLRYTDM